MSKPLNDVRKDYAKYRLLESEVLADPLAQLHAWLDEAKTSLPDDYNAMALSTVDSGGVPHSRIVLLRGLDTGLVFYTNYTSDKGRELLAHPACSILFFWPELERQVRVVCTAQKVDAAESDAYFASRPRESRLGAWVSDQSAPIATHKDLNDRFNEVSQHFDKKEVGRPEHWGGFRLTPSRFEFWQGRPSRLHDRLVYMPNGDAWTLQRLQP